MNKKDQEAIASLNQWRVPFLATPLPSDSDHQLSASELILRLIQSDMPRLKLGVTAFFLVHAEKAPTVLQSLALLDKKSSSILKCYYTAAVFLQRLWKTQLSHFGTSLLPDYFSKELGLPSPTALHSHYGLIALEETLQQIMHVPYNYLASFEALAHLLQQERGTDAAISLS